LFSNLFDQAMEETSSSSVPSANGGNHSIFVISVGGSALFSDSTPNVARIREIAVSISNLASEGYKFALVVGGGPIARSYISAAREVNANNFALDELGIAITRANAFLFLCALDKAHPFVLTSFQEATPLVEQGKIPVFGGLVPGFTTDAVGALLAEKLNATFVNLSNTDGIYSSNPATNSRARLYRELSFEKLFDLASKAEHKPGQNFPVDLVSAMILKRSQVGAIFLNANNMDNFKSAIRGASFVGTAVQESEEIQEESEEESSDAPGDAQTQTEESDESEIVRPKKKNPDDYFPF